jgi:hypothetical protein
VGSTKIRAHNLIKYWPKADLYKYGERPEVLIFQKVYCTYDYKFPKTYPGITILDVCDTDWNDTPDIYIKETLDGVNAAVVPTKNMQKLLQQMTDKPVVVIKDRFDLSEFPKPKIHNGKAKTLVWFGYSHNAELMNYVIPSIEKRGLNLIIISDSDPHLYKYANDPIEFEKKYTCIKYKQETIYQELQKADICVLPKGNRPQDRYKSENKTVIAGLCGLPVVTNAEELDSMMEAEARNGHINTIHSKLKQDYDVMKSIEEYKNLIRNIQEIG